MMLKRLITILLVALCVVLALFPVLVGGWLLCQAAGDEGGTAVFRYLSVAALCVLLTDILLLVAALAAASVGAGGPPESSS